MAKKDTPEAEAPAITDGLSEALFAVQQELDGITKDSTNPHFKSSYADRTTILQTIRPLYAKYGLLLIQSPTVPTVKFSEDPVLALETTIIHLRSGEKMSSTAIVPLPKADPQGYGSAITYTSRYALTMIHGLPLLDDDGNAGSGRAEGKPAAPVRKPANVETKTAPASQGTAPAEGTATAGGADTTTTETPAKPATTAASTSAGSKPTAPTGGKRKLWGS